MYNILLLYLFDSKPNEHFLYQNKYLYDSLKVRLIHNNVMRECIVLFKNKATLRFYIY